MYPEAAPLPVRLIQRMFYSFMYSPDSLSVRHIVPASQVKSIWSVAADKFAKGYLSYFQHRILTGIATCDIFFKRKLDED